jgi:hypothetical protein
MVIIDETKIQNILVGRKVVAFYYNSRTFLALKLNLARIASFEILF